MSDSDKSSVNELVALLRTQMEMFVSLVRESNEAAAETSREAKALARQLEEARGEVKDLTFAMRNFEKTLDGEQEQRKELEARVRKLESFKAQAGSPEAQAVRVKAWADGAKTIIAAIVTAIVTLAAAFGLARSGVVNLSPASEPAPVVVPAGPDE